MWIGVNGIGGSVEDHEPPTVHMAVSTQALAVQLAYEATAPAGVRKMAESASNSGAHNRQRSAIRRTK